ncbi:MAG TPA: T9SS type A sorting domain-containing protein [Chitinophagaceae bacterium]|nr:T9SS type A sorting domain-containing protein [Chitinophagaceae bacterium]
MRKNLYSALLSSGIILLNISVFAQDRFAYAITDVNQNTASWTVLRKLNLQTGVYSDALLNGVNNIKQVAYDAQTKKLIVANNANGNSLMPFNTGVAAIAYDRKNNRLYYTPMFIDQLRYIDLETMKLYYVTGQSFTGHENTNKDDGGVVSRMVIAPDGYGYAVTNDANNFVRFSTGKKFKIEQLGALVDDPGNTGISIHNRCSSWGGDMVADDEGNLYLISANNSVFKINIDTKVAKWLGPIKGLPTGFTINGVAVTDDGKLLAGSQSYAKGWYLVDPKSWNSTPYNAPKGIYLTSDLANSNFLSTRRPGDFALIEQQQSIPSSAVQLYPNPVDVGNNQFKLQFNKLIPGNYTVELTDVSGKLIMTQKINILNDIQVQTINLKKNTPQGIYLVKVSDISSKSIFTQKLVVQ